MKNRVGGLGRERQLGPLLGKLVAHQRRADPGTEKDGGGKVRFVY